MNNALTLQYFYFLFGLLIAACAFQDAAAQNLEPFSIKQTIYPSAGLASYDSNPFKNVDRGTQYITEGKLKFPVYNNGKGALIIPEYSFRYHSQSFNNWPKPKSKPMDAIHNRLAVVGIAPVYKKWSMIFLGGGTLGLNRGEKTTLNNINYEAGAGMLYNTRANNQLGILVIYFQRMGHPVPTLIYRGYSKNKKWSFNVRAPRLSNIDYSITDNTQIRFHEEYRTDRISYNQDKSGNADSYDLKTLDVSVGINQRIKGPVFFNLSAGLNGVNSTELFNGDNDSIERLRFKWAPFVSASIFVSIDPTN